MGLSLQNGAEMGKFGCEEPTGKRLVSEHGILFRTSDFWGESP